MQFCTIVARNYVSQALVLADSLAMHHPREPLSILLVDAEPDDVSDLAAVSGDNVSFVLTEELPGVERADLLAMRTFYDITELSTSLKPALLAYLREATDVVVYLDPDIALFAPLTGLRELATNHSIVVTPHVTEPMPRDGLTLDEQTILRAGIFNLGFIAVGPGSEPFLAWWNERLRSDALNDPEQGFFTDQRWIDFVPALFSHAVVRNTGWNVAYWNLHERPLSRDADGVLHAGSSPVTFFHFSGYDPATPHVLSKHQGSRPRVRVSSSPLLIELLEWYGDRLADHDFDERRRIAYRWGAVGGAPMTALVRRMHRRTVLGSGLDGEVGPDAFSDEAAFVAWLNEPVARSSARTLSRLQLAYWGSRIDLQFSYPNPTGSSLDGLAVWFAEHADEHVKATVEPFMRAPPVVPPRESRGPAPGVLVAGYLNAELGVGESARLMVAAAGASGLPVGTLAYRRTLSHQRAGAVPFEVDDGFDADLAVICVNADQTPTFFADAGARLPSEARRAGMWFWEVPEFPAPMWGAFGVVDEVWVATEFVADAVRPHADRPVRVVPLPVIADPASPLTRADLGLPDDTYLFGFACDARSVLRRKNPVGVLRAYLDAFPTADDSHIVLKLMNGHVDVLTLEQLRWMARERTDVTIVDDVWTSAEMRALTQRLDCYVSLHRSEGYGLGMAQAMAQGKPVVATGWSGNMEFMTENTAFLVPSNLVPVGHAPPYPSHARWAEPDHDAAVDLLRALRNRPGIGAAVGVRARADLAHRFSIAGAGAWVREHAIDASASVAARDAQRRVGAALELLGDR